MVANDLSEPFCIRLAVSAMRRKSLHSRSCVEVQTNESHQTMLMGVRAGAGVPPVNFGFHPAMGKLFKDKDNREVVPVTQLVVVAEEVNIYSHKPFPKLDLTGRFLRSGDAVPLLSWGTKSIHWCQCEVTSPSPPTDQQVIHLIESTTQVHQRKPKVDKPDNLPSPLPPIGGPNLDIMETIMNLIAASLNPKLQMGGISPPRGVLLHGPSGVGKSLIGAHVCHKADLPVFPIGAGALIDHTKNQEAILCLEQARATAPSIVLLDDVHLLCGKTSRPTCSIPTAGVVAKLIEILDTEPKITGTDNHKRVSVVFVLATTNQPHNIWTTLRRPGRFDIEMEVCIPSGPPQRLSILNALLHNTVHSLTQQDVQHAADVAHGFNGSDLFKLIQAGVLQAVSRVEEEKQSALRKHKLAESDPLLGEDDTFGWLVNKIQDLSSLNNTKIDFDQFVVKLTTEDLMDVLAVQKPSSLRSVEVQVPTVKWSDIGGQENAKQLLKEAITWSVKFRDVFGQLGINAPRGILLYGPPGCSKTLMAKALACEGGLNFLSVKGPELFSKYVGDSEKAVRDVFNKARAAAPSILFFDEIDGLCGKRGGGGVTDRVVSQLLTEMDGVMGGTKEHQNDILVVAATNCPANLDSALLRPGRIDQCVYIGLPELDERVSIWNIGFKKTPNNLSVQDFATLAQKTEGYTGAEIIGACREATYEALKEDMNAQLVTVAHIETALKTVTPRITEQDIKVFKDWEQQRFNRKR